MSYHRCSEVIDFQNTDGLDRSFISILLELLQTGRNNISRHKKKNQKGQKSNSNSYLSLLVLIFCRHALKPLPLALAKTDTGLTAFMGCVPHVAHITVSQMVHDFSFPLPHPLAGFSPSFHTTSGAVGPAPSSGGGLCRCTLQHISEKDPPQDEDGLRWQVPTSEQPEMFVMH